MARGRARGRRATNGDEILAVLLQPLVAIIAQLVARLQWMGPDQPPAPATVWADIQDQHVGADRAVPGIAVELKSGFQGRVDRVTTPIGTQFARKVMLVTLRELASLGQTAAGLLELAVAACASLPALHDLAFPTRVMRAVHFNIQPYMDIQQAGREHGVEVVKGAAGACVVISIDYPLMGSDMERFCDTLFTTPAAAAYLAPWRAELVNQLPHGARHFNAATVADLLAGHAEGVAALHAAGILHNDQKPNNTLVSVKARGSRTQPPVLDVAVTDLGAARLCASGSTLFHPDARVFCRDYAHPDRMRRARAGDYSATLQDELFTLGYTLLEVVLGVPGHLLRPLVDDVDILLAFMADVINNGPDGALPEGAVPAVQEAVRRAQEDRLPYQKRAAERARALRGLPCAGCPEAQTAWLRMVAAAVAALLGPRVLPRVTADTIHRLLEAVVRVLGGAPYERCWMAMSTLQGVGIAVPAAPRVVPPQPAAAPAPEEAPPAPYLPTEPEWFVVDDGATVPTSATPWSHHVPGAPSSAGLTTEAPPGVGVFAGAGMDAPVGSAGLGEDGAPTPGTGPSEGLQGEGFAAAPPAAAATTSASASPAWWPSGWSSRRMAVAATACVVCPLVAVGAWACMRRRR